MFNEEAYDRPSDGIGNVEQLADGTYAVRIVPIGEGDTTTGQSGKKTYWDRETLRQAVRDGVFDSTKFLKGRAGSGHKPMVEQAALDEIIGGGDNVYYEDGVGPVIEGTVIDEHVAMLVEHDLIEVSPDLFRELGEYNEDEDYYEVDMLIDAPYVTLLDRGAGNSADIEPATQEALGFNFEEETRNDDPTDNGQTDNNMSDQLAEQLADIRQEKSELKSKTEQLSEEKNELSEQLSEKESKLEEKEEQLSEKDSKIEQLQEKYEESEEEKQPFVELLAGIVSEGSMMSADRVAETNSLSDLVDMLSEADDEKSPLEKMKEQLSDSTPEARGQSPEEGEGQEQLSPDEEAEVNRRAESVMNVRDLRNMEEEQLSPREYVHEYKGVDPATVNSESVLRRKIANQE